MSVLASVKVPGRQDTLNVLLVLGGRLKDSALGVLVGHRVESVSDKTALLDMVRKNHYDLLLLEGDPETLSAIKAADPRVEVIYFGDCRAAEIEIISRGATYCLPTDVAAERIRESVESISELAESRRETAVLEKLLTEKYTFAGVVGKNPRMIEIFNFLRRIAPYYKTVTITGETGVGKEEVAKALHSVSPNSKEPFIACNCGGLLENLLESEFFGYRKGAFTGAMNDKAGIFEAAGAGVVFLDEIGDLPLSFQPHLLRVLQNGDFRRLGSTTALKARCRVIAATNRDLSKEVKDGRFREDLFFRLTPLTVSVPPLRERRDDIPLLVRYILDKFQKRTGKKVLGVSRTAQAGLISYDWPGNVRELENVVEQAAILGKESFIRHESLPEQIRDSATKKTFAPLTLDGLVKGHIGTVLKRHNGNKTRAAKELGITRRALLRKIEKYSIA
jgi:two-component system response regulator AtoC